MAGLPMTPICLGSMTMKNTTRTAVMTMLMQVKLTMPFLLPYLPTYLAPNAAKKMDGIMLITVRIVARPMLPMIMPLRSVPMMAWLPTCWASLSEALEAM